jgi:hypothetical protein
MTKPVARLQGMITALIREGTRRIKDEKADPDADIKNRIDSLREEAALLGQVADGEDKASEAAKARYDTTEGEFKNKSPQIKAELRSPPRRWTQKNADIEAEKKRKEDRGDEATPTPRCSTAAHAGRGGARRGDRQAQHAQRSDEGRHRHEGEYDEAQAAHRRRPGR